MAKIDITYHNLLEKILQEGYTYEDPNRKGVNRIEIPSYTFRHEFKDGFPAITTKKLNYKSVVTELIWFLRGDTNIKYLLENNVNIWNKDCLNRIEKLYGQKLTEEKLKKRILEDGNDYYGDLGPVYGAQWRKWDTKQSVVVGHNGSYNEFGTIIKDQISNLIKGLKERPLATDHIVNAWNVSELEDMVLQPCHYGFQIVVRPLDKHERLKIQMKENDYRSFYNENELDKNNIAKYGFELHWQQRSCDLFLGIPFNIASYATLALILEKITGYKALAIQGDLKKVHLYDNSLDAVKEQLSRDVDKYSCGVFDFPAFDEFEWETLDELFHKIQPEDITLEGYESYPGIKVEMLERDE